MPATHSSTQRRSSLKCPTPRHNPIHNPIRSLSLPTHHEKPQKSNRVRFAICTSAPQSETLRRPLTVPGSIQQSRSKVTQLAPTRIPCRIPSGRPNGISPRARKERSQAERNQTSKKNLQAAQRTHQRPRRISSSHLERTRASSDGQDPNATLSLYLPSHLRAALSPCLSSPSKINCSISSLHPGGCEKLLQKIHRPVPASIDQNQKPASADSGMDLSLKAERKAYTLSPSWCSPNIHSAAHKYNVSRNKTQGTDNEILSIFLKNNGGYLDDSDDEDEEEDEDEEDSAEAEESFTSVRATVAFLKRIPMYPFEFRKPTSLSYSEQFNDLSLLDISTSRSASDSSTSLSQAHSSPPRYYWNRVLPTLPVTSTPKSRSRFTFYKK